MMPVGIAVLAPLYIASGGVALYFLIRLLPRQFRMRGGPLTALWLLAAFCLMFSVAILQPSPENMPFLGLTAGLLITGIGAVAAWVSQDRIDPEGPVQLFYPLFLFALAGAVGIGLSRDLFGIFVMVELSAVPVYALCAYRYQEDPAALPAAMNYLLQGVAGTITALLGVAVLYMAGHTLVLSELPGALAGTDPALLLIAGVLILFGYGVKLAIVPMHAWLPEAYGRAPVSVTMILVGATKFGVLVALFLSLSALPAGPGIRTLGIVVIFLSVITMTAGNLLALNQTDLWYVLAYSSVAQMGYILLGFGIGMVYNLPLAFTAGLYYAIAYSLMKSGAFLAADTFATSAGSYQTARMKGLGADNPLLGISFTLFIFGMIGVPFTCGFLGKMLLEQAGMVTTMMSGVILALVLALNNAVSLGYYIPALSTLLFRDKEAGPKDTPPANTRRIPSCTLSAVVILAVVTVYFGLFPESFDWISHAADQLFTWRVP